MAKSLWEVTEQEFKCSHPMDRRELRYKTDSLGRYTYLMQCLDCGQAATSPLKHTYVTEKTFIMPFDEELAAAFLERKRQRYQQLLAEENRKHANKETDWFSDYNRYLQSPEWKAKREKVLIRDKYLCQACLERNATQVHHLSYDHVFNEPLFELVAVCKKCHESLTQLDTQRRNGNGLAHATTRPELSR